MTLLTELLDAGWKEYKVGEKFAAERLHARPGYTSSIIRVEAESSRLLNQAVTLRESQLAGAHEPIKDTITNDGTLVTGDQHAALQIAGVTVSGAEKVAEPEADQE